MFHIVFLRYHTLFDRKKTNSIVLNDKTDNVTSREDFIIYWTNFLISFGTYDFANTFWHL